MHTAIIVLHLNSIISFVRYEEVHPCASQQLWMLFTGQLYNLAGHYHRAKNVPNYQKEDQRGAPRAPHPASVSGSRSKQLFWSLSYALALYMCAYQALYQVRRSQFYKDYQYSYIVASCIYLHIRRVTCVATFHAKFFIVFARGINLMLAFNYIEKMIILEPSITINYLLPIQKLQCDSL